MSLPRVAIVGRPNVGKSSLLNRLAGRRISIVDPTPGVTRDRVITRVELAGRPMELVDTGGMGMDDPDRLTDQVEAQIWTAIQEADLLLFLTDVRTGLTAADQDCLRTVRASGKPILLVANKAERRNAESTAAEFFELGLGDPLLVSAQDGSGIRVLREALAERLPPAPADTGPVPMKLAIVGKRNVGKSTLVNTLVGSPRTIASEVPGTTRDAVDIEIQRDGRAFLLIDTAGVRKKGKVRDSLEFYGMVRSEEAIRRCDVAVLLMASDMDVSEVDKKLAALLIRHAKPCILAVNKWDLVQAEGLRGARAKYKRYVQEEKLPNVTFAPLVFLTATHRRQAESLLGHAARLHEQASRRVSTGPLNEAVRAAAVERVPSGSSKAPKIYYATQVSVSPPCFVLFVNRPAIFDQQYGRYMATRIRKAFGFTEVPVRVIFRPHRD